jgi:biotin carboxyl carrier protein
MIYHVSIEGRGHRLRLERELEKWQCELDGRQIQLDACLIRPGVISVMTGGAAYEIKREQLGSQTRIWIKNKPYVAEISDPRDLSLRSRVAGNNAPARLLASMPGKVLRVMVRAMDRVEIGQPLLVVEAMKMQNEIKSPNKGIVKQLVKEGANVNAGDVLAIVE